jgi:predicted dienelactone hydrolase
MKNILLTAFTAAALLASAQAAPAYNPLQIDASFAPEILDFEIHDTDRNRILPVRVYLPVAAVPAPIVLFSHGLGGSCRNSPYLGNHWAARGYVAVFVQHPGSDESVWKNAGPRDRMGAMQQAANGKNFQLRVQDIPAVIDQLEIWSRTQLHPLCGRMDLAQIGMSGHSFGARTTQAVSGESFFKSPRFTDPRIGAAVAFSPSAPRLGSAAAAFGEVQIPWMLMTGTKDLSVIGNTDLESRMAVYPALPPGDKYELVLHNAEHSAFSDRALPGDSEPRNPNHHKAILALSTAFWDAYLKSDPSAKAWLQSPAARSVIEEKDRWQDK